MFSSRAPSCPSGPSRRWNLPSRKAEPLGQLFSSSQTRESSFSTMNTMICAHVPCKLRVGCRYQNDTPCCQTTSSVRMGLQPQQCLQQPHPLCSRTGAPIGPESSRSRQDVDQLHTPSRMGVFQAEQHLHWHPSWSTRRNGPTIPSGQGTIRRLDSSEDTR